MGFLIYFSTMKKKSLFLALAAGTLLSCQHTPEVAWVSTTFDEPWVTQPAVPVSETGKEADIVIDPANTRQTIDGLVLVLMNWDGFL